MVCYARAVIEDEWPAMREGRSSELVQPWIDKLHGTSPYDLEAWEETAYAQWFDEQAQRRDGRRERLAEAAPFVPIPLWLVLSIGASLTIAYMVAQADQREGLFIQAIPIGFVTAFMTAGLLVIFFLDHPYADTCGTSSDRDASDAHAIDSGYRPPATSAAPLPSASGLRGVHRRI